MIFAIRFGINTFPAELIAINDVILPNKKATVTSPKNTPRRNATAPDGITRDLDPVAISNLEHEKHYNQKIR